MEKIDLRKLDRELYRPPAKQFALVEVPNMQFVKIDGSGNPNTADAYRRAVEWLYAVSYGMKFAAKASLGRDYVVPPLEGLWWADDPSSFVERRKDEWRWTMMIRSPDFVGADLFRAAREKAGRKFGAAPDSLRLEPYAEGLCLQILHIGSYDAEGPTLARLHGEVMPAKGLTFNGPHHEIYLGDPRRSEPDRLKTILRQPVRRADAASTSLSGSSGQTVHI